MPAKTETATQAAWPEGVIARYLTVGGATVEITQTVTHREEGESGRKDLGNGFSVQQYPTKVIDLTLTAKCSGCKDNDENEYDGLYPSVLDRVLESTYGRTTQRWAQAHAEKCRAMPRPAGE